MKKVILSALVVGSLLATSCKEAKEGANALKDGAGAVVEGGANVVKDGANAVVDGAGAVVEGAKDGANAVVDGAKDGANAVVDGAKDVAGAVKSAITGVEIPEFSDPAVGAHLQSYAEYAKDYIAAGTDKSALLAKGTELATKGAEILKGLDAESATKFTSVLTAIQSKMAPAK